MRQMRIIAVAALGAFLVVITALAGACLVLEGRCRVDTNALLASSAWR